MMHRKSIAGGPGGAGYDWVDLHAPSPDELDGVRDTYGIAVDLMPSAGRAPRPGILDEGDYTVITLVGAVESDLDDGLGEVRCIVGPGWLVTIHDQPCAALGTAPPAEPGPAGALEAVARTLVTSLVELMRSLDSDVEGIEDGLPGDLAAVRRRLSGLRRTVLPQRDVLLRLGQGEGLDDPPEAVTRDLRNGSERMAQIGGEVEVLREALHDAMTDRQNDVVKRLTVVAVIFLPMTFLTGFFGQNFPWLVDHIGGGRWFVALGLLLPVVSVAGLLWALRRIGWS